MNTSLSKERFEQTIRKSLRTNQALLYFSISLTLIVFFMNTENVLWSMLFLGIGSFSLITINNCKSDRSHFNSHQLSSASGKILDVFPQDEKEKVWIVFLYDSSTEKTLELITPDKPDVELETYWQVLYTPKLKIIVQMKEKK